MGRVLDPYAKKSDQSVVDKKIACKEFWTEMVFRRHPTYVECHMPVSGGGPRSDDNEFHHLVIYSKTIPPPSPR